VTQEEPPKQAEETAAKPEDVEMEDLEVKTQEDPVVKVETQPIAEEKEGPKDSPDTSTAKEEESAKKDKAENKPGELKLQNYIFKFQHLQLNC
jgi:hypothetical protein